MPGKDRNAVEQRQAWREGTRQRHRDRLGSGARTCSGRPSTLAAEARTLSTAGS